MGSKTPWAGVIKFTVGKVAGFHNEHLSFKRDGTFLEEVSDS
jgi:hypothetical protein